MSRREPCDKQAPVIQCLDKQAMPKNIIIVGAPRSGTSLTAAIFARKGYFIGKIERASIREGDDNNPFGYFEADDLISNNVEVLRRAGFTFHNTWKHAMISERSIARLADLLPSREHRDYVTSYQVRAPWVWKDPRLCFTLPYWWKLMDPRTTGVLLVRRDEAEVYRSFLRMGWCDDARPARERCRARIERHVRAAKEAIARLSIPHITVDYADFLDRPDEVAPRLAEMCGLDLAATDLNVRTDLNHSSPRGRFSALLRRSVDRGVFRRSKVLRRFLPDWVLATVFPEKKYLAKRGRHKQC